MIQYIGTKVIKAKPMNRAEYNAFRGWTLPADEDGADEGYLVEYQDGGKPNCFDKGFAGYVSWSPKEQFEMAYRPYEGIAMTFGQAIESMKRGHKVARAGWNGKGMWISVSPGSQALPADKFWNPNNRAFAESKGGTADVEPTITMKTARDTIQMGWSPTVSDALAEDWYLVD